jgi:phage baseplate assembly protein W
MSDRPHFDHPFTRGTDGKPLVVEQDTVQHVTACALRILVCPQGFRFDRPDFGIPWPKMKNVPLDTHGIDAALRRLEPRGRPSSQEFADVIDAAIRNITTNVETS